MIKYQFFDSKNSIKKSAIDYQKINVFLKENGFNTQNNPVLVNQVHGKEVLVITNESQIPSLGNLPDADAIITNQKNINIGIATADCAPIILFDEQNKIIAAAHAGWKGAFVGVVQNTVQEMLKLGAEIENIKCEIGPMIRQKSYEIDERFYKQFLSQNAENKKFFILSSKADHYLFDLAEYVAEKLCQAGIKEIQDAGIDTYKDENFESFRRKTHQGIKDDENRNVLLACLV